MKIALLIGVALAAIAASNGAAAAPPRDCALGRHTDAACSAEEMDAAESAFADAHLRWFYAGDTVKRATVYSLNTVEAGPAGHRRARRASLSVIRGAGMEYVSIASGGSVYPSRLACSDPGCPVMIQFDQGPLQAWKTHAGNGERMDLIESGRLLAQIGSTQTLTIFFPIQGEGSVPFQFDVRDFHW
jgi:hypothetical protein